MKFLSKLFFCFFVFISCSVIGDLTIGVSSFDITPPIGTPSAGYQSRRGEGMLGVRDQLLANAMVIDNGKFIIAFCGVDHLGFDRGMVEEIRSIVQKHLNNKKINIIIGGSHTHSGGGAYLNYPIIGEAIAGKFNPKIRAFYIEQTANSIIEAVNNKKSAKIGIGYGILDDMNEYRGKLVTEILPRKKITVIKATTTADEPLGIFFNFPVHPVILPAQNRKFSADLIGSTRQALHKKFDSKIISLFFNGAQGDVNPNSKYISKETYDQCCNEFGKKLAKKVFEICNKVKTKEDISINFFSLPYDFEVKKTSNGLKLPLKKYFSELNLLVLDEKHGFLTIPGELSCIYDYKIREEALKYFEELSILGLVNDAHGYILLPKAWDLKSPETTKSFGGREYGPYVFSLAKALLFQSINKEN
jgi:hypothetical protein